MVSAITTPPAETRTRFGFAVMVMGWSGPGSFMGVSLFGQPVVIVGHDHQGICKRLDLEYSAGSVT